MSLEATLILLDNSAFAINGDYDPTRWQSQVDSASLLIQAKLQANQQSSVGVALMGGDQVQLLCTLTSDSVKANSYLFGVKCGGDLHFTQAIQIGALSLKHRSNQTQKPRMVCFVGSSILEDAETLKILAKKLKKNGVAVDLVCFGDCHEEQLEKGQSFVNALQNQDNSHFLVVKPGENLCDKLIGSPIIGGGAGAARGEDMGMGNLQAQDPQLAAAIRMSLQQSQRAQPAAPEQPAAPVQAPQAPQAQHQPTEQELQQLAIQMSLAQMQVKNEDEQEGDGEKKQKKQ